MYTFCAIPRIAGHPWPEVLGYAFGEIATTVRFK